MSKNLRTTNNKFIDQTSRISFKFDGKTLYGFKAINITLGLPFLRITPDHGPNNNFLGKNISDPSSVIEIFKFLSQIREY